MNGDSRSEEERRQVQIFQYEARELCNLENVWQFT